MPELPEVEGVRRWVSPLLLGKRIEQLEVRDAKLWRPAESLAAEGVAGRAVLALDRRAKLLIFSLEADLALVLHLKIAGQVAYQSPTTARLLGGHPYPLLDAILPSSATRFLFKLEDGGTLYVNDQRRFAWLRLLRQADLPEFVAGQRYGPDPLDSAFTTEVLAARLRARKGRPIKSALLDQTCIAGLGNIYADEALHHARLHPMMRAGDAGPAQVERLHDAIVNVLAVAVPVGGALIKGGHASIDPASGRDFLRAHGRAGQLCQNCAPPGSGSDGPGQVTRAPRLVRAFLASRGTYFCPVCQPAPPGFAPLPAAERADDDGLDAGEGPEPEE